MEFYGVDWMLLYPTVFLGFQHIWIHSYRETFQEPFMRNVREILEVY